MTPADQAAHEAAAQLAQDISAYPEQLIYVTKLAKAALVAEQNCNNIVALASGWDEYGALGPKEPYRWETVARLAMDYAKATVAAIEQARKAT